MEKVNAKKIDLSLIIFMCSWRLKLSGREFRLIGLVAQGSIPWACVGLIAFLHIVFLRLVSLRLSVPANSNKEVVFMKKTAHRIRLFGLSILETIWAIETNSAAGALPA